MSNKSQTTTGEGLASRVSHTPGPWRIGDAGNTVFGPPTSAISPRTVARIPKVPLPCKVSEIDENIANAHLIAAAPELLSVLEQCLVALIDETGNVPRREYDASVAAREAIARAKGGAL